jgi:hypothetical protein
MPTQLAMAFDVVPVTCPVQQRYHSIVPCVAGISTPVEQAQALNIGYPTVNCATDLFQMLRAESW